MAMRETTDGTDYWEGVQELQEFRSCRMGQLISGVRMLGFHSFL